MAAVIGAQAEKAEGIDSEVKRNLAKICRRTSGKVIEQLNPVLRGWVNYFAVGNSSRCFSFVRSWVEKKIRRHLMRAQKRKGFGWKRWSSAYLYEQLGLFKEYRVRPHQVWPKVAPAQYVT